MTYPHSPFNPIDGIYTGTISTTGKFPVVEKPFKLGFMLGRFQHIHIGHELMINKAINSCEKLIILVGSEQESYTKRNPFNVELRMKMMQEIYGNCRNIAIHSIPDLTHENDHSVEWGRFVLENVAKVSYQGTTPDLMIYGNDEERNSWFDPDDIIGISRLIINRGMIEISATKMREYLINNNFWKWSQYANPKIHYMFDELRKELQNSDGYGGKING